MTLYRKIGEGRRARYVPVAETVALDSLPTGSHLIEVTPGSRCVMFQVNPDTVALLAAARPAMEAMTNAILEATRFRPTQVPITPQQRNAWDAFSRAMGKNMTIIKAGSAQDIAEAGVKALIEAARKEKT